MANANVSVSVKETSVKEITETKSVPLPFPVPPLTGSPAKVGMGFSRTENLGNYRSLKIEVYVELPCAPTPQGVEAAMAWAGNLAEEEVTRRLGPAPETDPKPGSAKAPPPAKPYGGGHPF